MSYPKSINCIEFLMDFFIYDAILYMIQITDKNYCILNPQNQVKFYMQIRPVFPGPVTYVINQFSHCYMHTDGK